MLCFVPDPTSTLFCILLFKFFLYSWMSYKSSPCQFTLAMRIIVSNIVSEVVVVSIDTLSCKYKSQSAFIISSHSRYKTQA